MPTKGRPKSALVDGAVKPWHVVFLFFVAWSVAIVGSFKATHPFASSDGSRDALQIMVLQAIFSLIILAFTAIVPEFRRSLGALFTRPLAPVEARDWGVAFAACLAWGYGIYRIAICFPVLVAHPEAFHALSFTEALGAFEPRYLVWILATIVIAPVAEELVFRGFLLNLWIARRGLWFGLIASSVVFGLFHLNNAIFAAPMGLIFALVYLRYDSLWPGIFLHAAYNLLSVPWILGGFFYVKQRATLGQLSSWIPELLIALASLPLWILFWRRFKPA